MQKIVSVGFFLREKACRTWPFALQQLYLRSNRKLTHEPLRRILERLSDFCPAWHCRRSHRVSTGKLDAANLRIAEALLHLDLSDPYWKMYTVVIQLGAILALLSLFTGRIIEFFRTFPKGESGDRTVWNHPITLTAVAFLVTRDSLPAAGENHRQASGKHHGYGVGRCCIGGVAMWAIDWWSDRRESPTKDVEQMSLWQAVWIGAFQILSAVFPGTSRSMSTISSGQLAGTDPRRISGVQLSLVDSGDGRRHRVRPPESRSSQTDCWRTCGCAAGDHDAWVDHPRDRLGGFLSWSRWGWWSGSSSG